MTTLYQSLVAVAAATTGGVKPYHSNVTLLWQLDITSDGQPSSLELTPLTRERTVRGATVTEPGASFEVPRITRTSAATAMLACDDVGYVLGWSDDKVSEAQALTRHQLYLELTGAWAGSDTAVGDPVPRALLAFLTSGGPQRMVRPASWTAKDGVLVTVKGQPAHQADSVSGFWGPYVAAKKGSGHGGLCLVCGQYGDLVDTLPQSVKGAYAPGGQTTGVAPISINKAPFGFQLKTGLGHVPICSACALAIPTALNMLLGDETRIHRTAGSRTTWWVDGGAEFNLMVALDAPPTEADIAALLSGVETGRDLSGRIDTGEFHALTVSGNVARLVIREWYHLPLDQLKANIRRWFHDIETVPRYPDGRRILPLSMLATATGRYDENLKGYLKPGSPGDRRPHGITDTLRGAALRATPIPPSVLAHLVQRIAADHRVDDARAALLRLILVRTRTLQEAPMPGLDPQCTNPPYVLGRLFALYEALQLAAATADGGKAPNATFADKHFAGAISSPQLVLTAGARQSAAWLGKLRKTGRDRYYRRDIDQLIDLLTPQALGPGRSSLQDQAEFVLGYHHQRAHTRHQIADAVQAKQALEAESPALTTDQLTTTEQPMDTEGDL